MQALAVLCLPTLLVPVDFSVLFLALPRIGADPGAGGIAQLLAGHDGRPRRPHRPAPSRHHDPRKTLRKVTSR